MGGKTLWLAITLEFVACKPNPPEPDARFDISSGDMMSARLGDVVWKATIVSASRTSKAIGIIGDTDDITMELYALATGPGTYYVADGSVLMRLDVNFDSWSTDPDGSGSVTITSFTVEGMTGTFDITAAQGALRRRISDGTFAVTFSH